MIFSGMPERYRRTKVIVPHLDGMQRYLTVCLDQVHCADRAVNDVPEPPREYPRELYSCAEVQNPLAAQKSS
jgi:hypothetical protein